MLPNMARHLDPYLVSELDRELVNLSGGAPIGQAIVDEWIATFRAQSPTEVSHEDSHDRPLHPAIKAEFEEVKAHVQARTTVLDACIYIIENGSWGTMQEVAMKQATATDFELAIRGMEIEKLPRFMRHMIKMRLQRTTYDSHFGTASERFVDACRIIANDASTPRLATLMKLLFERTALAAELNSQAPSEA